MTAPALPTPAVGTVTTVPVTDDIVERAAHGLCFDVDRMARMLKDLGITEVPSVDAIDVCLEQVVTEGDGHLCMATWHYCETAHCRAGWAVHLAGSVGYALEEQVRPWRAGALIYAASRLGAIPNFYASDHAALASIRADAAAQLAARAEVQP